MKRQYKEQTIWFPVLRCGIQIFWTKKFDDCSIAFTKRFDDEGQTNPQIYFNANKKVPIATISHELLHAVRDVMYNRGFMNMDHPDDEGLTYYHAYCLGECLNYANKHNIELCNPVNQIEE
jgi:hypothetical protein